MSINVDALQTFTDPELLKLYRWAMAVGAAGQTRTISGRSVTFPNVKDLRETIAWLEARGASSADGGGVDVALGTFLDPR